MKDRGVVNPLRLFDLQRRARLVAAVYRALLQQFGAEPLLPNNTLLGFFEKNRSSVLERGPELSHVSQWSGAQQHPAIQDEPASNRKSAVEDLTVRKNKNPSI
jgi:hypothetical protein